MSQEECKGGNCELRPQFDDSATEKPTEGKKVRLSTSKYVQLLIDARETDPDCWPPGLEEAAGMVEQARAIEEACIERWGEFDPDKLPHAQGRRYFEIQLALDALQEDAPDAPLDLQSALSQARHNLDAEESSAEATSTPAHSDDADAPGTPSDTPEPGGYALPTPPTPSSGEGFYAAPLDAHESFFLARSAADSGDLDLEADAGDAIFLATGWVEIASRQRPDNYA